jgi:hypothetical protein
MIRELWRMLNSPVGVGWAIWIVYITVCAATGGYL